MNTGDVDIEHAAWRLAVALGIGLLLGIERERRKGTGPARAAAGIRTFALVSLLGGVVMVFDSVALLATGLGFVALLATVAYALGDRSDPGITTEMALPVTFLLGALAYREPALAAGIATVVAALLASRAYLQRLAAEALSEQEIHDGLLLAAAALVVLPLVPDEAIGPYDAFNPFAIWRIVVLVMAISAVGYVSLRLLGPRLGLPIAGFASGFVSSSATIGAMGTRARSDSAVFRPAVAAAVLSTLATVVQMVLVVGATDAHALRDLLPTLAAAGVAAAVYAVVFGVQAWRHDGASRTAEGRAFDPRAALLFAGVVGGVLFLAAVLNDVAGNAGVAVSAAVAGFADTHAAAISVASLVATGKLEPGEAVVPILAGFTTNSVTKAVLAWTAGGRQYALAIWPGLAVVLAAAWGAWAITST